MSKRDENDKHKEGALPVDPTEESEPMPPPAKEEWPLPIPFSNNSHLSQFPVDCLTPTLRAYAESVAAFIEVPVDLVAMLMLSALAACCAKRIAVEPRPGYVEPVNLFTVTALPPGERKSAALAAVTFPLEEFDREEAERMGPEVARLRSEIETLEKRKAKLQDNAAKTNDPDERDMLAKEAADIAEKLVKMPLPEVPSLLADDVTAEKLARLMAANGGRMAIFSAEGGIFGIMGGRYSADVNLDVFLKGHAGEPIRVGRNGGPSFIVDSASLTLGLTVQPDVIQRLADEPQFKGRGLLARFLYSIPGSLLGARSGEGPEIQEHTRAAYRDCLRRLLKLPAKDGPTCLRFTDEARRSWLAAFRKYEKRLGPDGQLAFISDWVGKSSGATARIAALLHAAGWAASGGELGEEIGVDCVNQASRIVTYLTEHAIAAYGYMGADARVEQAQRLARWLEAHGKETVSLRDLFQAHKGRFRTVEELKPVVGLLIEHRYLRTIPPGRKEGPGRPPSQEYAVNPETLRQNPQNPQNGPSPQSAGAEDAPEPRSVVPAPKATADYIEETF